MNVKKEKEKLATLEIRTRSTINSYCPKVCQVTSAIQTWQPKVQQSHVLEQGVQRAASHSAGHESVTADFRRCQDFIFALLSDAKGVSSMLTEKYPMADRIKMAFYLLNLDCSCNRAHASPRSKLVVFILHVYCEQLHFKGFC